MARSAVLGKRIMNGRRMLTRNAVKQLVSTPLTISDINSKINSMYCLRTEQQLSDQRLMKKVYHITFRTEKGSNVGEPSKGD